MSMPVVQIGPMWVAVFKLTMLVFVGMAKGPVRMFRMDMVVMLVWMVMHVYMREGLVNMGVRVTFFE